MLVVVNVYGVLTRHTPDHREIIRRLLEILELPVDEDALLEMKTLEDVYNYPPLVAYMRSRPMASIAIEEAAEQSMRSTAIPAPGAQVALYELAQHARIFYTSDAPGGERSHIQIWLKQHRFPEAPVLASWKYAAQKLLLAGKEAAPDEQILLIDHDLDAVLYSFKRMLQENDALGRSVIRRLKLVSFGHPYLPPEKLRKRFNVPCLPAWDFLPSLEIA